MHHSAKGVAGRVEVDVAGVDQNKVGLFAWRQAANLVLKSCAGRTIDGGRFKQLRRRKCGQCMGSIAALLLMHAHHPLQVKGHAHFHKHVSAVRGFVVDAEAGGDSMTLRCLHGKHTVFDAVVRI